MQNAPFRFSVLLSGTLTTNLLNPGTITGGVNMGSGNLRIILTHLRVINQTGTAATFSFWIGATGGNVDGTEFMGQAKSVPANDYVDWYGRKPLLVADFLVGGSGTASALVLEGEGEIGVQ